MIAWHSPRVLSDLFAAFDRADAGESAALGPDPAAAAPGVTAPSTDESWLGVTSSGSTGTPKLVWCRWTRLKSSITARPDHGSWLWASPYAPWSFAGVQVALQAWLTSKRVLSLQGAWSDLWSALADQAADAISATPTFMDLLLQNQPEGARGWSPLQVTLGGEPLRTALGERLRRGFPTSHFTVIYAAAEFGVLARTQRLDGWYEKDSLDRHCGAWRVSEGVLEIQRGGEWRSTGDRIDVAGELIKVTGRADSVANVAGTKVSLPEIAEAAEQVPGVRRAVAVAEPSPITGQVVCLRFAVDDGMDPGVVELALQTSLRARLRKECWPRRWVRDAVGPVQNAKRAVK